MQAATAGPLPGLTHPARPGPADTRARVCRRSAADEGQGGAGLAHGGGEPQEEAQPAVLPHAPRSGPPPGAHGGTLAGVLGRREGLD